MFLIILIAYYDFIKIFVVYILFIIFFIYLQYKIALFNMQYHSKVHSGSDKSFKMLQL